MKTEKTGYIAKTFFGTDAIKALKAYIEARRKGSRKIDPETVTKNSPLFRTWEKGKAKRMSRMCASTIIRNAFLKIGEKKMSAHSLRKALQTNLEKGGMPTNWIDQVLGHELINSRDAYSLPTEEELKEAYMKAYEEHVQLDSMKKKKLNNEIKKEMVTVKKMLDVAEARTMEEVKTLLSKGYKYEMEMNGIKLFTKK
jgi:hypothetical protein